MLLTSGGTSRWKRKRDKASRLRPVAEDAASTTQLFNGNGRGRPRRSDASTSNGSAVAPAGPNGSAPLLRYEWRSASGETLVVEAAWPAPEQPLETEPTVTPASAPTVTVIEPPIVVDHPRLDLRS